MEQTSAVLSPACIYTFVTMRMDLCSLEMVARKEKKICLFGVNSLVRRIQVPSEDVTSVMND